MPWRPQPACTTRQRSNVSFRPLSPAFNQPPQDAGVAPAAARLPDRTRQFCLAPPHRERRCGGGLASVATRRPEVPQPAARRWVHRPRSSRCTPPCSPTSRCKDCCTGSPTRRVGSPSKPSAPGPPDPRRGAEVPCCRAGIGAGDGSVHHNVDRYGVPWAFGGRGARAVQRTTRARGDRHLSVGISAGRPPGSAGSGGPGAGRRLAGDR